MATFSENIYKIRGGAIYGTEVREAIAEALEQSDHFEDLNSRLDTVENIVDGRELFVSTERISDDNYRLNITNGSGDAFMSDLYKAFHKVGVIGDSLSVGYMYNKSTQTATSRMLEYSWPKVVMRDAEAPWLNLGTSGQSVITWCSNVTYGKVQAEASGNKCQAYIIGLGENDQSDSARGCPLGTPADITGDYTQVATTYYGGYVRIIEILKHINPTCKIFCLTNPRSGGTGGDGRARYNEAVRYIANTYYAEDSNVLLLDMADEFGYLFNGNQYLPSDSASMQGGHYSPSGYTRIATIIEKMLSMKMESTYGAMLDIAYIPYDTGNPTANTMTE